jgi:hypothetical protein
MSLRFHMVSLGRELGGLKKGLDMSDKDDVRNIITPVREAKIYRAIHQAWADVMQDRARYPRWPRTRANMMFERLAIRSLEQFFDDPGMHFAFHDETVKFIADQNLLGRLKKANNRGLGQNVPSHANDLFCDQESFSMIAPLDKVEIVYVVNRLGTEISKVLVQARDGDVRLWAYEIDDTALASIAPVVPMPPPAAPPALVPDAADLVQPRSKPASKDKEDKE